MDRFPNLKVNKEFSLVSQDERKKNIGYISSAPHSDESQPAAFTVKEGKFMEGNITDSSHNSSKGPRKYRPYCAKL